jgi:hypothetical protein
LNYDNNKNLNNKLIASMQLINLFIGVIIALICVVAYITIDSIEVRGIIIFTAIILGIVCFVNLYKDLHKEEKIKDESNISGIELVNEENEIIRTWDIGEKISFLIGKNTIDENVFIDLNSSIYSTLIENNHAVLNYATGKWYIEDLSSRSGVSIQKIDDNKKYRIVKDTPCELKKGDIIFISKVKLLLK